MPTIRVIPLDPDHARVLAVEIAGERRSDPETDAAWDALRREDPSLFDGPIVLVEPPASSTPALLGTLATYRHVATTPITRRTGMRSLGVKGLLLARGRGGVPHALVGLRGSGTRMYPGMWELGPAGCVEPPTREARTIPLGTMIEALRKEGHEELGFELPAGSLVPVALVDDPEASSVDVLLRCELEGQIDRLRPPCRLGERSHGEYAAAEWVLVSELPAWIARSPGAIAPPTAAIIEWLRDA